VEGWALNISAGGLRAVIFSSDLAVNRTCTVRVGAGEPRPCRVAWHKQEPDGQIVGVQFLDVEAD